MLPIEQFPTSRFTEIGTFQVTDQLAIGEGFEHVISDAGGSWRVRWITTETADELYGNIEDAGGDPDAHCCQQLQAYLIESDPDELVGSLAPLCVLPISGAYFRIGDDSLRPIIEQQTALGPLFDGVEGLIGGAGAAVYLGGDGRAEVHVAGSEFGPELIHVNLR